MGPRCLVDLLTASVVVELNEADASSVVTAVESEGLELGAIVVFAVAAVVAELRVETDEPLLRELPVALELVAVFGPC